MNKKELMIKAHKMTREVKAEYPEVDYKFQFSLCLSFLIKNGGNEMKTVENVLNENGFKTWEKGDNKRVYINDVTDLALKLDYEFSNKTLFRKSSMVYDVVTDKFNFNCQSSVKQHIRNLIKLIREECEK